MTRLMSVAYTEEQVRDRIKHVTRRLGWLHARPGMELDLCSKVMGRRKGEPLVRLTRVRVLEVSRERLERIVLEPAYGAAEMVLEGFPGLEPAEFIRRYFTEAQKVPATAEVTRIRWEYLDPDPASDSRYLHVAARVTPAANVAHMILTGG